MARFTTLVFCGIVLSGLAAATTTFDFSYVSLDGIDQASGSLLATANGDGSFTAFSGFGEYDGFAINLIANPSAPATIVSPSGYFNYDDQIFPSASPKVDYSGLLFSIADGGATELNLYYDSSVPNYIAYLNDGINNQGAFSTAPEPATSGLIGISLLGLGFGLRRMRKRAGNASQ